MPDFVVPCLQGALWELRLYVAFWNNWNVLLARHRHFKMLLSNSKSIQVKKSHAKDHTALLKLEEPTLGTVVHSCNPSYTEGRGRRTP